MFLNAVKILMSISLVLMIFGCKSEVNTPDGFDAEALELYKFETVESDLALLKDGGMPLPEGDGVFSIGWKEIFRPFDDDSKTEGMAFAVAFGNESTESSNFPRFGLDMGMISIGYNGNQILMHKMFRDKRGTAYSLFNRPFGDSDVLLEFIPNTEYTFDISGSENFASTKINLKSPDALINIMNHNHGDSIDPARDLTIIWEGGNQASKVAIQVMAHFKPQPGFRGPQGGGGNERRGPGHHPPRPPLKNVIIEVLENNPGQYTISAEKLQKLISESGAEKIVVGVSQFDLGVIEHDGKNIHSAMRNGTSLILAVN
jgi:hypothetical protein